MESSGKQSDSVEAAIAKAAQCVFYGVGIIAMLGVYGVVQERIMSEPYVDIGGNSTFFRASVFLVLCNRLVAIVYAMGMVAVKGESYRTAAPLWKYFAISMSNVAATTMQYEALKFVSFPVQMLGKSFKMMPVMIWSIIISGKTYKLPDWFIAAMVTLGVTLFLMTGVINAKHSDKDSSFWGLLCMLAYLAADSFTSTFQEKLFKDHNASKFNQMMYVNCCSATVSFLTLIASGKLLSALAFSAAHPVFMGHAFMLSAAAVGGQFFIYSQVKEFGALVLAATMNIRQVLSILMSYLLYSHSISWQQVMGLFLVFGSLFYKSYLGFVTMKRRPPSAHNHQQVELGAHKFQQVEMDEPKTDAQGGWEMQKQPAAETIGSTAETRSTDS